MSSRFKTAAYYDEGFRQLEGELRSVMEVLAEAVPLDEEVLRQIPWRTSELLDAGHESEAPENTQLLGIVFELLNMVEEHVAFRFRSSRRAEHGPAAVDGLWPSVLAELAEAGVSEREALDTFRQIRVEPVLTAHPTEAKRPEVREKHLAIYRKLVEWEAGRQEAHRSRRTRASLRSELETLWLTGEIFIERPRVENELRNAAYYLREVFPEVVLRLDRSLELAWEDIGWSVERLREENAYPQIRFATWIGGDRDGHPLVTAEVTKSCLAELRSHAARLHRRFLRQAAEAITHTPPFAKCPGELEEAIRPLADSLGEAGHRILARNPNAPWRAWLYLLREKMGRLSEAGGYQHTAEYLADLDLAHRSLVSTRSLHAAREWITPLMRLADVYGFQLAALDVRQNSATHDQAAASLFARAGLEEGDRFGEWDEARRQELLARELRNPRPLLAPGERLDEVSDTVVAPLRVLARHAEQFGTDGLGQLIVSMTRQPSDLLLVHILCREAGIASFENGRWKADLPVSPLFETGEDLAAAASILRDYLETLGSVAETQPAMVGYSDSNKDAGVFASQWAINQGLESMSETCSQAGTTPVFFHGRGGTIGRGAGPTHWFLRALPPSCLTGPMRLTEQGEVLPRKYSHEGNAHFHLELLVAGVASAVTSASRQEPMAAEQRAALDHIATASSSAYQQLLRTEGFIDFYRSVTPIDALEAGTFGSRPPRRRKTKDHSLDDLRAIPWVFSWTQSRFYLPGWFGVGSGLAALQRDDRAAHQRLQELLPDLPFLRYTLTNVESSLASADPELIRRYASLCESDSLRTTILTLIENEFELTRAQLAEFFGDDFSKRRPRFHRTLALREKPLQRLHHQQIALLREWRARGRPVNADSENVKLDPLFLRLQLSINAISSGLRETG